MLSIPQFIGCCLLFACTTSGTEQIKSSNDPTISLTENTAKVRRFSGAISNGMKGDSLFFDLSADGTKLNNLIFKGYWRCSGKLESTRVGPEGSFKVLNGRVNDHISEPPGGGSTAWRFDLDATIKGITASGTFRMNINNLGCDTYLLKWTASAN